MEIIDNEQMKEKLGIVARQTDYDEETIKTKLIESNYDHLKVIKEYLGLNNEKTQKPKSINQEIYKQIRSKIDVSDFNKKQAEKLQNEINTDFI
jgi:hypothetical protein